MASLMTGPTLEEAKQLPYNTKSKRVAKMVALSAFIPQNAVDQDGDAFYGSGGIIENFNGYNAVVQKPTPSSMEDDAMELDDEGTKEDDGPSLRIRVPPQQRESGGSGGRRSPDIVLEEDAQKEGEAQI